MDALRSKLSEFGEVERFWMDRLRSHCYASYSNSLEAANAIKELQGYSFQPGLELSARTVSQKFMEDSIHEEESKSRFARIIPFC